MSAASYRSVISTLRKCQKELLVLIFFDFETPFSAKLHVYFSNPGINRMLSFRGELFFWGSIVFVPGIRILIVLILT